MKVKTYTYPSGLRLVVETLSDSKAATLFVGINTGSVNETDTNNGISHVIEHMLFKGTNTRDAQQISKELEDLGANVNAFTSKYHTCFYASCMSEYMDKSFDVLSDMIFNSVFDQKELNKELKVIYEEIDMYQDDPSSVCYDRFNELFFAGTKLEKNVIGTKQVLSKLTRQDILDYMSKYYTAPNMVISVAGGIDFDRAKQLCDKFFANNFKSKANPNVYNIQSTLIHKPKATFDYIKKDIAQTHIIFGYPTYSLYGKHNSELNILSFILGGGMSSRLFQTIREKYGYVYSINALPELYDIGGVVTINLATNHQNQKDAVDKINEVISDLVKNGITEEELARAKTFCKSMIVMSSETTINIARHNVANMIIYNEYRSLDTKLNNLDKVQLADINALILEIFETKHICGAVVSDKPDKTLFDVFAN